MATITGTVNASIPSATANPAGVSAHYSIASTNGIGYVLLQKQAPGTTFWTTIAKGGSSPLNTPDTGYLYRFKPVGITEAVSIYFGP